MSELPEGERGASAPRVDAAPTDAPAPPWGASAPRSPGRRWLLAALVVLVVAGFAGWYWGLREPEPRNDFERFQGDWSVAAGGREGRTAIRVIGDRWEYVGGKAYRLTLHDDADPKQIDLEPLDLPKLVGPPPRLHGVYAFDDNRTVRVILGPAILPRPTALDDPDVVLVLTKVKLEAAP